MIDFAAVRVRAMTDYPYLSRGFCLLVPVITARVPTMAVDRFGRVYVNPDRLQEWGVHTSAKALLHELSHWLREHFKRTDALLSQQEQAEFHWLVNYCQDAEINDDIEGGPKDWIYPATLGCEPNQLWEQYYRETKPRVKIVHGMWNCGSGSHGIACPWDLGLPRPDEGLPNPLIADSVRREIAADILRARGHGTDIGASWLSWAQDMIGPAKIPWEQQLRGAVQSVLASAAGQCDYSYQRRSRRRHALVRLPGMVRPVVRVNIVLDTSGSMYEERRTAAVREALGIAQAVGEATVLCVDGDVQLVRRVQSAADIELLGGGGTDMAAGIAAAERLPGDLTIVLTDGATPWPTERPKRPVIVVLIGDDAAPEGSVPSYAQVVKVP